MAKEGDRIARSERGRNGSPLNGNFWVYYGALSNVEYRLLVTDTVTGLQHEYRDFSGHFGSVGDIDPF